MCGHIHVQSGGPGYGRKVGMTLEVWSANVQGSPFPMPESRTACIHYNMKQSWSRLVEKIDQNTK